MTPTADFTSHLDDLVEPEPNSRGITILEAHVLVGDWREEYNKSKPHSAHRVAHPRRVRRGRAPAKGAPTSRVAYLCGSSPAGNIDDLARLDRELQLPGPDEGAGSPTEFMASTGPSFAGTAKGRATTPTVTGRAGHATVKEPGPDDIHYLGDLSSRPGRGSAPAGPSSPCSQLEELRLRPWAPMSVSEGTSQPGAAVWSYRGVTDDRPRGHGRSTAGGSGCTRPGRW